jgi:addiction module HigA family antidote
VINSFPTRDLAIHPGQFLAELLEELHISQAQLARATQLSAMRISPILRGERPMTADTALRFGRVFKQSPQYWLNLQDHYDLVLAQQALGEALDNMPAFA